MKKLFLGCAALLVLPAVLLAQSGLRWVNKPDQKIHELQYNGKLLTAYRYDDSLMKAVLYPLNTVTGKTVTRGYPLEPRPGERTDHPHHVGLWLNYESVNGLDFWNNSTAIAPEKRSAYGTIYHERIEKQTAAGNKAELVVTAVWKNPAGGVELKERTSYQFEVKGKQWTLIRSTSLTAADKKVEFKDVKDGFFAIRVARELEHPSKEAATFVDVHGVETHVDQLPTEGITGLYTSSEGLKGDAVWSSRARWVMLNGSLNNEPVGIALIDHPKNIGYPTYWHARGYGLFALNPLGAEVFSNGKENRNLVLNPGESVQFKYAVVIQGGQNLDASAMNKMADRFAK
ncbi:MAG TPA: PmoA family protein [Flavihumibacter sp.]